jgi:hypothetical protein
MLNSYQIVDKEILETNEKIIQELEESFFDIPFGNTSFQTKNFVIAQNITPERAYRQVGQSMFALIEKIKDLITSQELLNIDKEELEEKYNAQNTDKYEKRRLEIKLKKINSNDFWFKKGLKESIEELNDYYSYYKALPKYTKQQFEDAEENYFIQSLNRKASGFSGAVESLVSMKEDLPALNQFIEKHLALADSSSETLKSLRLNMLNQIKEK